MPGRVLAGRRAARHRPPVLFRLLGPAAAQHRGGDPPGCLAPGAGAGLRADRRPPGARAGAGPVLPAAGPPVSRRPAADASRGAGRAVVDGQGTAGFGAEPGQRELEDAAIRLATPASQDSTTASTRPDTPSAASRPCMNVAGWASSAPKTATARAPPTCRLVLNTPLAVPARCGGTLFSRKGSGRRRSASSAGTRPRCPVRTGPATAEGTGSSRTAARSTRR